MLQRLPWHKQPQATHPLRMPWQAPQISKGLSARSDGFQQDACVFQLDNAIFSSGIIGTAMLSSLAQYCQDCSGTHSPC